MEGGSLVGVLKAISKYNKMLLAKLVISEGNLPVKIDRGRGKDVYLYTR